MPITYKCPSCGSAISFDEQSQMINCTACGLKMPVQDYEQMFGAGASVGEDESYDNGNIEVETITMKTYHCQSCGAELMSDEFTSAVMCAFCGNPSLVEDRLQGAFKPSRIIPFKINRDQAKDIYRSWAKKGKFTPSTFTTSSTIEKISGMYVPFWLYDYNARSNMSANAKKVTVSRSGNTETTRTDHFFVYRDVEAGFLKIPADASQKMDDDAMDKMEPYNYEEMQPFAMPYLSGYLSERYNFTSDMMLQRVGKRVNEYITDITRDTIKGYDYVSVVNNQVRMNNTRVEYVLLPVWVLNCRYKDKDFTFMLNGQTGKIVANRPTSKGKAVAWGLGIFAALFLIMSFGGMLIW